MTPVESVAVIVASTITACALFDLLVVWLVVFRLGDWIEQAAEKRARHRDDVTHARSCDMPAGLIPRLQAEVADQIKQMRKEA